jgi:biopolymer transport protein ExbB/TolQ
MQPLNRAERSSAFTSFLILFSATVAIIAAVIFFSIKVPFVQNDQLRSRMQTIRDEQAFTVAFADVMKQVMEELARYDLKNETPLATKQRVRFKLDQLSRMIRDVPDQDNSIYALIVRNLSDLNEAKAQVRELEDEKSFMQRQ